jgi:cold shock CspA family protein
MSNQNKRTGWIAIWFAEKSYGFIHENRDGKLFKAFLHISDILVGIPATGATVLFNEGSNSKGALALDVEVIQ